MYVYICYVFRYAPIPGTRVEINKIKAYMYSLKKIYIHIQVRQVKNTWKRLSLSQMLQVAFPMMLT